MPRLRAISLMLAVSLAAGTIINLATAWACCWWQRPISSKGQIESMPVSTEGKGLWTSVFGESVFLDRIDGGRELDPDDVPKSPVHGWMTFCVFENRWTSCGMERWSLFDMSRSIPPGVTVVCAGWPMRAFHARYVMEPSIAASPRSDWERGGFEVRRGNRMIELPWKPLMPGFAVNTAAFSAIAIILCMGAGAMRGALRRHRGLCERCAYPVGQSSRCSECGCEINLVSTTG